MKIKIFIILGALAGLLTAGWFVFQSTGGSRPDIMWCSVAAVYVIGVCVCLWGMLRWRRWALILSYVLAAAVFVLGCFFGYFLWDFWLFTEPTLLERVESLLDIRLFLYLIGPVVWIIYFSRQSIRKQF